MTVAEFWAKVDKRGPVHPTLGTRCWLWTAGCTSNGYGECSFEARMQYVHRVSWRLRKGYTRKHVLHKCDVRRCLRPSHLFTGRQKENILDMCAKGRQVKGERCHSAILTVSLVREIRRLYTLGFRQVFIAERLRIAKMRVNDVVHGRTWKHVV